MLLPFPIDGVNPKVSNDYELVFGILYLAAVFIIYSFQYTQIIFKKNVRGLNPIFIFLGNLVSLTACLNSLIFYFPTLSGCSLEEIVYCINKSLGFYQIASQFICFFLLYILFIYYSYFSTDYILLDSPVGLNSESGSGMNKTYRLIGFIFSIFVNFLMICLTLLLLFLIPPRGGLSEGLVIYGRVLGTLSSGLVILQYLPQIIELQRSQDPGVLSLTSYVFLCFGNLASFCYLFVQGVGDVTTWLPYVVCFLLQLTLIIQIIIFSFRSWRRGFHVQNDDYYYFSD